MNHAEIVDHVAKTLGTSKREAENAVKETMAAIAAGLLRDGEARLNGVGILKVTSRAARQGKNPTTGETITIPAGRSLKITVAQVMKEKLNA